MKNNKRNISDDVLVKCLLGEATPVEQEEVQQWINESPANRKYYDQFKLIWDESKKLEMPSRVNTEEAWARFMQRVEQEETQAPPTKTRTIPFFGQTWARVAAMLVLLAGASWFIYTNSGMGDGQMLAQSFDKVLIQTLPDGSVVTLNKHSSLSYPSKFEGNTRSVTINGEAFFNITPNKAKPFVIDAGNSSVTVVGTSFNVKARGNETEVIVETGIVEVAKKASVVRLLPGEKATVITNIDTPITAPVTDELYNYYRSGEFVCNAIPLHKLVSTLNEAFSAHIIIEDDKLKTLPITTTFKNESLETILNVVAKSLTLKVEKKGNDIILKER